MARDVLFEFSLPSGQTIRIVHGDLTEERVDAIVNAANDHLAHGGGVAGAIVREGGLVVQEESTAWVREHGPVRTGTAAMTGAGRLHASKVIHAVGPVWRDGRSGEEEDLASAVQSALALASEHDLISISLPAISSGIFGFPKKLCAQVILKAVGEFFQKHPDASVQEVNLVNIDHHTSSIFSQEAQGYTPD